MRRLRATFALALGAWMAVLALDGLGTLRRLELITWDLRLQSGVGRAPASEDILIAWIDQDSIDYMLSEGGTSYPWPRHVYGDVLRYLRQARLVVFDILMDQPMEADGDRALGEVLAMEDTPAAIFAFKLEGAERAVLPIEEIRGPARALGFVNIRSDEDRVFRRMEVLRTWEGGARPSLALAAAMEMLGVEDPRVGADGLELGDRRIPLDDSGRMALSFRGPEFSFPQAKFVNIFLSDIRSMEGEPPVPGYEPERFAGKTVIVGVNAAGQEDVHATPLSQMFPGPEMHATALDNLLRGDPLEELGGERLFAAGAALGAILAVLWLPGVLWPALAASGLALILAGASLAMFGRGMVLPTAAPLLAIAFAGSAGLLYRLLVEGRQKRELRRAFSSYMAPELVAEVVRDPARIRLGGQLREVTVLFTDLAGFTGLAERSDPQQLVAFLNDYFTRMGEHVMAEGGMIDKFIGDAIMALFGAPLERADHAPAALRAALACEAEMRSINAELTGRGLPAVATRVGIHTGTAVVGNMGSARRFEYTAIGDAVNLASRLEGANKSFGTHCLVSESTWMAAHGSQAGREVGRVRVVGRSEPLSVYEPLARGADSLQSSDLDLYKRALEALRASECERALGHFEDLARRHPGDGVVRAYIAQLGHPQWDGVFALDRK